MLVKAKVILTFDDGKEIPVEINSPLEFHLKQNNADDSRKLVINWTKKKEDKNEVKNSNN